MQAKDFDQKFDEGQDDILDHLDLTQLCRVNQKPKPTSNACLDDVAPFPHQSESENTS